MSKKTCRRSWCLFLSFTVVFGAVVLVFQNLSQCNHAGETVYKQAQDHTPPVLYGHIHVTKTGGTSVNGELALNYERVCGNKGYSYDAYQLNEQWRRSLNKNNTRYYDVDVFSQSNSRARNVPFETMLEIVFEDCDYVSIEARWLIWPKFFGDFLYPVELHVPCRDPIDHLLSQCNHIQKQFSCHNKDNNKTELLLDDTALKQEADQCMLEMNRFSNQLLDKKQFSVKCYDYQSTGDYLQYMGQRLQPKRIQTDYVMRRTNRPRNKSSECLWGYPTARKVVERHLMQTHDYYQFCNACLGSRDDLLSLA